MKHIFKWFLHWIPRPWLIQVSLIVRPFLAIWYIGTRYTDPIDGKRFRSFLPYGYEKTRENVLSPSTLSLERHRLLWLYLKNKTDFFKKPGRLLHFAPEQAFYQRFKRMKQLDYVTTDLNSPLATVKADICNLPFQSNSFDVILCNHVLEHIPDHLTAIQELYRVMRPGGWGIIQVPLDLERAVTFQDDSITDPVMRRKVFGQYDHVRIYGRDYFEILAGAGFEVQALDYTRELGPDDIETYRLSKGELLPIVRKPLY